MLEKLKAKKPFTAMILFPGDFPPHPEHWQSVEKKGFQIIKEEKCGPSVNFQYRINHPKYGIGNIVRMDKSPPPPAIIIEQCDTLTTKEKLEIFLYRLPILFIAENPQSSLSQNYKNQLRFVREIMGDQAEFMIDEGSYRIWSKECLDDEIAHEAPLGIEAFFSLHLVSLKNGRYWMHTHGLANFGFFDFDIVDLKEKSNILSSKDFIIAIATRIVEGSLTQNEKNILIGYPDICISMVEAQKFNAAMKQNLAEKFRPDHENDHDDKRCIVCDPIKGWFGKDRVIPNRWFQKDDYGEILIHFSNEASEAMRQRANSTITTLRKYFSSAKKYELTVIAKMGYEEDNDGGVEHLWFKVNGMESDHIEAELVNQPFNISKMKLGDRGKHDYKRLSDWKIITPLGISDSQNTVCIREFLDIMKVKESKE